MSTEASSTSPGEPELRERFDEVVLSCSGKHTNRLHLPEEDGNRPLCDTPLQTKEWLRKPFAVYPMGYREVCDKCSDKVREQEPGWNCPRCGDRFEDVHGLATHVGKVHGEPARTVKLEVQYGNALKADW